MKKLIIALIALVLLGGLVAILWTTIVPLVKDEVSDYIGGLFETTPPETTSKPIPDGAIEIPYAVYFQDPETGEYQLKSETTEYILEGYSKLYEAKPQENYVFNEEKSHLLAEKAGDAIVLYYDCETCRVIFDVGDAEILEGSAIQTVRKGQTPKAPTLSLKGYALTGFDKAIEKVYADTVYIPTWEIQNYLLRLHVAKGSTLPDALFTPYDGAEGVFDRKYTYKDSFTLPTPECKGYTFIEWNTSPDGDGTRVSEIDLNTYADTTLFAIYNQTMESIIFKPVDSLVFPAYYMPLSADIHAPTIPPEAQKPGYGIVWYTDSAYTERFEFRYMPYGSTTLWGRWEKDTGDGFLPWGRGDVSEITVDSLDELVDFLDYVRFYDFTEAVRVEVTYTTYDKLKKDVETAQLLGEFRANGSIAYTVGTGSYQHAGAKCYLSVRVNHSYRNVEATKTAASNGVTAYDLIAPPITPRGESYTDFYIDRLTNAYPVSTTNQLHYVVEHGYRPLVEKNSPAEAAYLAARKLLNEILPENASQYEKAELIFNYLITEIEYDDNAVALSKSDPDSWPEYDAYYLEGVFNKKKAVCDGIAKAYSLLCNIEGIPCVEVVGPGHAWNRVKINNLWYVVDATFGNLHITGSEKSIADHAQFLISDSEKTAGGYAPQNYLEIVAEKSYDYYRYKSLKHNNYYIDFRISSYEELSRLLEYAIAVSGDLTDKTINFYYTTAMSFDNCYRLALKSLERRGITIKNSLIYYGAGQDSVYKIAFT